MTQEDIIALKKRLSTPQNIAIVIHYNPDGDALGSSLALAMYLTKLGHRVNVLSPNIYPAYLEWMPNCEKVLIATEQNVNGYKIRSTHQIRSQYRLVAETKV